MGKNMLNIIGHLENVNESDENGLSKNTEIKKIVICRENGILTHCWWECKLVQVPRKTAVMS